MSMEDEAFFVFVGHAIFELPPKKDSVTGKDIMSNQLLVNRLCMQKTERQGLKYKRIQVKFDPLEVKTAYLVVAYFNKEDNDFVYHDLFRFVKAFSTEEEAKQCCDALALGDYRKHREPRETFVRSEVLITPVSRN